MMCCRATCASLPPARVYGQLSNHQPARSRPRIAYQVTALTRIAMAIPRKNATSRLLRVLLRLLSHCLSKRRTDQRTKVLAIVKGISLGLFKIAPEKRG